jgi:FG-GAP-like repeat/PASTA domain
LVGHTLEARFNEEENRVTSHLLQHVRRFAPESFHSSASAVLLACVGLALMLGVVVASSAPAPAPSFAEPKNYGTGPGPDALAIGELNGDGRPDLVTANGKAISVLLNGGDGSFQARRDYRARGTDLAIGDLNGDGKLDLATTFTVFLNRGDGSFRAGRAYPRGSGGAVAIGDLNGDRKLDLAFSTGSVQVLLNKGDGSFGAVRSYGKLDGTDSIAIGDLNGDRTLDLAAPNNYGNTVSVFLNRGKGRFGAKRDYRAGPGPYGIAIGDLNGDGKLDLVTPDLNSGDTGPTTSSVLLNRGDGSFRARRVFQGGGDIALGDLNGDRRLDLVMGGGAFVSVLLNRGDGSFQAWLNYRVQAKLDYRAVGGDWVAIGDLNGDGKPDLATANTDVGTVSALINTPGLCVVQDVRRMTLPVATRTIERVNCHVGEVGSDYSQVFKRGLVMRQKPTPGAVRPNGAKVDFVVSLGRKQ